MTPWKIFLIGSTILTFVSVGVVLLSHRRHQFDSYGQDVVSGGHLLMISLWLASVSTLAYIAFAFGKR